MYLKDYESPVDLESGLTRYFDFYDHERIHQSLDYRTPWEVFQASIHATRPTRKRSRPTARGAI